MDKQSINNYLNIRDVLVTVIKDINSKKIVLAKKLLLLTLIMFLMEHAFSDNFESMDLSIQIIFMAGHGVLFALFAVTCHRIIILGGNSVPKFGVLSITGRELRFIGRIIIAYAYFILITYVLHMIVMLIFNYINSITLLVICMFMMLIPGLYLFSRLALLFPATAVDNRYDMKWAWDISDGNGFRLIVLVWVIPWIFMAGSELISKIPINLDVLISVIGYVLMVFEISILSHSYMRLSETRISV